MSIFDQYQKWWVGFLAELEAFLQKTVPQCRVLTTQYEVHTYPYVYGQSHLERGGCGRLHVQLDLIILTQLLGDLQETVLASRIRQFASQPKTIDGLHGWLREGRSFRKNGDKAVRQYGMSFQALLWDARNLDVEV
jgi:hypothetical protein